MVARQTGLRVDEMDGTQLHDAAEYLRGKIRPVPVNMRDVSDRRAREAHLDWYRQTRRNALALWLETVNMHGPPKSAGCASAGSAGTASVGGWPDDDETTAPCLLWCSGRWHSASAGWSEYPEKETLKVVFAGYDAEDAVFVHPKDARIRRAVLDPRRGRDHPNHQVLKGIFPKEGDFVRLHVMDAAEAGVFVQEGVFLAGVVDSPSAAHDSSLVRVAGLAGTEEALLVVPNTRMEHISAQEFARMIEGLETARNQVLRQLDIATSQTIAIQVVSEVGEVVDDRTEVSVWALGDQMLIRVWQRKGEFTLETSAPASDGLAAVGLQNKGLTVLTQAERKQLLHGVAGRLRLSGGGLTMNMETKTPLNRRATQDQTGSEVPAQMYRDTHMVEGVAVETVVEPTGCSGSLHVRSTTVPPGPERVYDIVVQPEDWAALGYPSLPWLNGTRSSRLGQQLTRCVCARDGSLVLQIGRQILRSQDWFPLPPSPGDAASKRMRSRPQAATSKKRETCGDQRARGDLSSCKSGGPPGLCSCRVIIRKGASLPLSIAEPTAATTEDDSDKDDDNNNNDSNDNNDHNSELPASTGSRWLVIVKATGNNLSLSLIQPSRRAASPSSEQSATAAATTAGLGATRASGTSGARKMPSKRRAVRRCLSLAATWDDWGHLGYGPLQWMSHEQKALIARLSLYWISMSSSPREREEPTAIERHSSRERTRVRTKEDAVPPHLRVEAVLRFRPVVCSLTRPVGSCSETMARAALRGDCQNAGGERGGGAAAAATPQSVKYSGEEEIAMPSRVLVRDEGGVFRVEVAGVGWGGGASHQRREPRRIQEIFGKEAWQKTGLGELLWLDCSSRQYLANRLAQQVAFTTATECNSGDERSNQTGTNTHTTALVIVSDLALPYWRGTVAIARLGSHAEGVFVKITDAGQRLLIEAEDFEGGPLLASSTVSLEGWTAATGMVTLKPPSDSHAFKKVLEDQLAALLGAGFRSRTSRLEKKRLAKEMRQEDGGRRRWRGTLLELSEMEKGEIVKLEGDDSGSESGDVGTPLPVQKAPSSLPRLSPRDLSPLEQKRALRLEMLTRMKEEFHAKHGRRHRGGLENIRNKVGIRVPGAHTSATVVDPDGQSHGPVREGSSATAGTAPKTDKSRRSNVTSTSITERNNTNDDNDTRGNRSSRSKTDKSDTSLPVTAPSTPHDPRRHSISNTEGTSTNSPRRSTPTYYSGQEHPAALTRDVSGSSMDGAGRGSMAATVSNQGAPVHLCVCCGGEGGKGHGRLCEHMFRRCGFCRVEEVKRVLGIRGLDGRVRRDRRVSGHDKTGMRVPTILPFKDDGSGGGGNDVREEEEEEEFEWVTDSEEEDPEFQCDSCGSVIAETADRFHCETCGDHDLCQACFLSSRKTANGAQSADEGEVGGGHLASHDVTQIMGKPTVLGR